jgi:hypothetical protein
MPTPADEEVRAHTSRATKEFVANRAVSHLPQPTKSSTELHAFSYTPSVVSVE